jgi:hypothetical protein
MQFFPRAPQILSAAPVCRSKEQRLEPCLFAWNSVNDRCLIVLSNLMPHYLMQNWNCSYSYTSLYIWERMHREVTSRFSYLFLFRMVQHFSSVNANGLSRCNGEMLNCFIHKLFRSFGVLLSLVISLIIFTPPSFLRI